MKTSSKSLYDFVFKGLLTEEALDRAGRSKQAVEGYFDTEIATSLSIELLDDDLVNESKQMAAVYTVIAAFENSVRDLVADTLLGEIGANWWKDGVGEKVRSRAESRMEDEQKNRWHTPRGSDPMNYTELSDLVRIIRKNQTIFQPYFPSIEWIQSLFDVIERSRNVIMHSGTLSKPDIERLGINIRDWVKQVGV